MFISNRFPSALHAWSKQQRIAVSADVRSPEDGLVEEFPDPLQKKEEKREPSTFLTTKSCKVGASRREACLDAFILTRAVCSVNLV